MSAAWRSPATSRVARTTGPARARVGRPGPRPSGLGAARFPAAPVQALIEQRSLQRGLALPELAIILRIPLRTLHRILQAQLLGWMVADRCAVALGYHPCQLWPDWFADDPSDDGMEAVVRIAG